MKKKDQFIRKPVVFNKESLWHMEIYNRIMDESNNFSGYVMGILRGYFDSKPEIRKVILEKKKEGVRLPDSNNKELEATFTINGKKLDPQIISPKKS
jgi:hypothetical protein